MKILIGILFIFILACLVSWVADTHRFVVRYYKVSNSKIRKPLRAVMISDLHNKVYGHENDILLSAIDEAKPDIVLIAGDLLNGLPEYDNSVAINILERLVKKYPLYYGYGNHEYRLRLYPEKYGSMWQDYCKQLDSIDVHVMDNEHCYLNDYNIDIAALTVDKRFYQRFRRTTPNKEELERCLGESNKDAFQLLIAHNPEFFESYAKWGADLSVSGHVHGGIMRLPFIGGIVSPRLVVYPKYSDGQYSINDKQMIVSCGLGTHTLHVRVFNPGELSVIDIVP